MNFSFKGISSKREYAFTLVIIIAVEAFVSAFFSWTLPKFADSSVLNTNLIVIGTLVSYAINICAVALQFAVTTRRLRGLGRNPWLVFILIIPLVNLIFALILLFGPESKEHADEIGNEGIIDTNIVDAELKKQAEEATKTEIK